MTDERRHGPRRGIELFVEDGGDWIYRKPFFDHGAWRVRRRHKRSDEVETITLDKAENITQAKAAVKARAERERSEATERSKAPTAQKDVTLGDALEAWLKTVDVRPATKRGYEDSVALYKRILGEEKTVREITFADVEALFTGAGQWAKKSGRTKILHRGILARIWAWFIKRGFCLVNVADMVEIQKRWSKEASRAAHETGQALSVDEARALINACREPYLVNFTPKKHKDEDNVLAEVAPPEGLWLFTYLGLMTGLRRSNLLGGEEKPPLPWGMIDLEKGVLSIPGKYMKNDFDLVVPLHDEVLEVLRDRLRRIGGRPEPTEPVIPAAAGLDVKKSFASALKRAGLRDRGLRVHDLRHTHISWLGENCTHSVMQVLAGHKGVSVTDRYGAHQNLDVLRRGVNSLPRLLATAAAEGKKKAKA